MKIRDTLIISLAIIAAGYMVADSLKPVQAFSEGDCSMVADAHHLGVWVLETSTGKVKRCAGTDAKARCSALTK